MVREVVALVGLLCRGADRKVPMRDTLTSLRGKAAPYVIGGIIAAVLYVFPDAKPIACGLGFALPFSVN